MSMTEIIEAPKKRKYPAKRKRKVAAPKQVGEYAGLTAINCCTGCAEKGCVISGRPYCGHPFKGGLQGADTHDPTAIGRFNAAKAMLGKAKIKVEL